MTIGAVLIRNFGRQEVFKAKFERNSNLESTVFLHDVLIDSWLFVRIEASFIVIVVVFLLSITFAKQINLIDEESINSIGLLTTYIMLLNSSAVNLTTGISGVIKESPSAERIYDFTFECQEQEDDLVKGTLPDKWPSQGGIVFKNLDIRYRTGLPLVLDHFNLEIKGGESIGIIGRTGSGKSTLFLALFRLIESSSNEPSIFIDGIDIKNLGLHELRKNITIIPQDPFVIEGTIQKNIDPFDKYSEEEIMSCLDKVGILKNINSNIDQSLISSNEDMTALLNNDDLDSKTLLENYLHFRIESNGANLSAGQRQLISIARALIRRPKILLMDEATSCIDERSDTLLQKIFKEDFKTTTIITIAHRLDTLVHYDRIVVIDKGKVSKIGTPKEIFLDFESNSLQECL